MSGPDVQVGSWKPHKPRGPISAHYTSPGPKYALPPLIGKNNITMNVLGSQTQFYLGPPKVWGPAAYTLPPVLGPHTLTTTTAPSYSLYGRSNKGGFQEDLQKSPGPGTYKVVDPCVSKRRAPWYSMRGRNIISYDTRETPGPGTYYPEQKAPSFSFGVRHSEYIVPLSENEDN
uniref:Ciliary microtubule associated protein 1B n=1 Tax=Myripristis murdjan TaxID=586833 RepID=A0A667ZXG2_9TELE